MTRYLISFDAHAMDHIPGEEVPAVGKAAHAVVQEAVDAGVWVFGGGLGNQRASIVATDGTVTGGPTRRPSRSGRSCPTPNKTPGSTNLTGDDDFPGDV
jgi:hypothetical protein